MLQSITYNLSCNPGIFAPPPQRTMFFVSAGCIPENTLECKFTRDKNRKNRKKGGGRKKIKKKITAQFGLHTNKRKQSHISWGNEYINKWRYCTTSKRKKVTSFAEYTYNLGNVELKELHILVDQYYWYLRADKIATEKFMERSKHKI